MFIKEDEVKIIARGFGSKFGLQKADVDDLIQTMWLHFLEINDDKRLEDYPFRRTCLLNCARNWFRKYCRETNRYTEIYDCDAITESDDSNILYNEVMDLLTPQERTVMEIYFGINGNKSIRIQTIATMTKITQRRVRELISTSFEMFSFLNKK